MLHLGWKRNLVLTIAPWENSEGPLGRREGEIADKGASQGEANHSSMPPDGLFNEPACHSVPGMLSRCLGVLMCFQRKLGCF